MLEALELNQYSTLMARSNKHTVLDNPIDIEKYFFYED